MNIDRTELQDSARKLFEGTSLVPERDKSWDGIVEMGWPALIVPEELGGLGEGRAALATLYCELGRVLAPVPFLPAMLAIEAISRSTTIEGREGWIERLIGGEIVTCSMLELIADTRTDDGGTTFATARFEAVPDADKASHILIVSRDRKLCSLVPIANVHVSVIQRNIWDLSRRLFDVELNEVPLDPGLILATGDDAVRMVQDLRVHRLLGIAADCVGASNALLEMTVDYLQTRRQFSRPLAMFQALKHRVADLKALIESADALFEKSVGGQTGLPYDPVIEAGAVKSYAAWVFRAVAEESIQLHGGIGLTEEHPCHLFFKRSFLNANLGGTIDQWETAAGEQAIRELSKLARA